MNVKFFLIAHHHNNIVYHRNNIVYPYGKFLTNIVVPFEMHVWCNNIIYQVDMDEMQYSN